MVTDKTEENNIEAQRLIAVQNNPNYNGILATKLKLTEQFCQDIQIKK